MTDPRSRRRAPRAVRAALDLGERLPLVGGTVATARTVAGDLLGAAEATAYAVTRTILAAVVREVVDVLTAEVDLTALVADHVDIDSIVAGVDLDAAVARVDLDAAVARVDLDAAIKRVDLDLIVDAVDLNRAVGHVDLMAAITRVDIDEVVATVDLDRAVSRVDLDAVLARVDLIALATEIIDGIDLSDIIRDASTSVTADVMTDVRSTSERADDVVADLVGRLLRRRAAGPVADG